MNCFTKCYFRCRLHFKTKQPSSSTSRCLPVESNRPSKLFRSMQYTRFSIIVQCHAKFLTCPLQENYPPEQSLQKPEDGRPRCLPFNQIQQILLLVFYPSVLPLLLIRLNTRYSLVLSVCCLAAVKFEKKIYLRVVLRNLLFSSAARVLLSCQFYQCLWSLIYGLQIEYTAELHLSQRWRYLKSPYLSKAANGHATTKSSSRDCYSGHWKFQHLDIHASSYRVLRLKQQSPKTITISEIKLLVSLASLLSFEYSKLTTEPVQSQTAIQSDCHFSTFCSDYVNHLGDSITRPAIPDCQGKN